MADLTLDEADEDKYDPRVDIACQRAVDEQRYIVLPAPDELFLDIDDEAGVKAVEKNLKILTSKTQGCEPLFLSRDLRWSPSPSGGASHYHVTIRLDRAVSSEAQRAAWQLALGSDRTREALSLVRAAAGQAHPTLFFEKDDADLVSAFASAHALGGANKAMQLAEAQLAERVRDRDWLVA